AGVAGGDDPAVIVLVLDLLGALAFIGVGVLLLRSADDDARTRAGALWCANPLLWLQLVAGAHLDVLVAALALAAVISARRRPVAALLAVLIARTRAGTTVPLVALAVTMAYVLAAPYALPWYDALPWALLPLVAVSWRSWLLLAHTTVLSLAYLPGRDAVHLHG